MEGETTGLGPHVDTTVVPHEVGFYPTGTGLPTEDSTMEGEITWLFVKDATVTSMVPREVGIYPTGKGLSTDDAALEFSDEEDENRDPEYPKQVSTEFKQTLAAMSAGEGWKQWGDSSDEDCDVSHDDKTLGIADLSREVPK